MYTHLARDMAVLSYSVYRINDYVNTYVVSLELHHYYSWLATNTFEKKKLNELINIENCIECANGMH